MYKLFTQHPASVGETYFEHLLMAGRLCVQHVRSGVCLSGARLVAVYV